MKVTAMMGGVVSVSSPTSSATLCTSRQSKTHTSRYNPQTHVAGATAQRTSRFKQISTLLIGAPTIGSQRLGVRCNSSSGPRGPGSGDNESRTVLDAFFLGKALAEAVNERIESAVGEFLSTIGRLQAEQQRQIQDFQEDVFERAKKAKEKAAVEAMEGQGLVPKPTSINVKSDSEDNKLTTPPSTVTTVTPSNSSPDSTSRPTAETDFDPASKGPV